MTFTTILNIYLAGVAISFFILPGLLRKVGREGQDHLLPVFFWPVALLLFIWLMIFGNPGNKL